MKVTPEDKIINADCLDELKKFKDNTGIYT